MPQKINIVYGVSLSTKACDGYGINTLKVLEATTKDLGFKRFRLMSYWDECEPKKGEYNFDVLSAQIRHIASVKGEVTLCLGVRQPRWPECHAPEWAKRLDVSKRRQCLFDFIRATMDYVKDESCIVSFQLENEALNKGIGTCDDYDRSRLRKEYKLVKSLAVNKPVIMTTTNSWGLPLRRPIPDVVGFSMYRHQWGKRGLSRSHRSVSFVKARKFYIENVLGRPVFCHELQLEPWGPKATHDLSDELQKELMDGPQMNEAIEYAKACGMQTIDMWGLEWWYWRKFERDDSEPWQVIKDLTK